MLNKWGGGTRRHDTAAAARSIDRQWADHDAQLTPCERTEAEDLAAEGLAGFDPQCRFARDGFELGLHYCTRRDGRLVEVGEEGQCFAEQRQALLEQGATFTTAERAARRAVQL